MSPITRLTTDEIEEQIERAEEQKRRMTPSEGFYRKGVSDALRWVIGLAENEPPIKPMICEWFALCDHETTHVVAHPILGDVPICERCAEKLDIELDEKSDQVE